MPIRISQERFEELVDQALDSLPQQFLPYMENVVVEVHDRPSRQLLSQMGIGRDHVLLGYYQGVPLTEKSVSRPYEWPERILIFKRSIEAVCDSDEQIVEQVRKTVLHEVGHHFGMDEDDLDKLGYR